MYLERAGRSPGHVAPRDVAREAFLAISVGDARRRRRVGRSVFSVLVVTLSSACASTGARVDLPPVTQTPTNRWHTGQFVWHDLVTEDAEAAKSFYGALFGWQFEDVQGDEVVYTTILHRGVPIGGIAPIEDVGADVPSSRWLSVLSVVDVDAAISTVELSGGSVNMAARDNPTRGRMALVTDPQGAMVVLVRAIAGDPPLPDPDALVSNRWMWNELWTRDLEDSAALYARLVGYEVSGNAVPGAPEVRVFTQRGEPRAGLNLLPWPEVQPNWLPYVKVDDAEAIARRVEELGGTVLIPPLPELRNGTSGLMMDPTGAAFAIQEWPLSQ